MWGRCNTRVFLKIIDLIEIKIELNYFMMKNYKSKHSLKNNRVVKSLLTVTNPSEKRKLRSGWSLGTRARVGESVEIVESCLSYGSCCC